MNSSIKPHPPFLFFFFWPSPELTLKRCEIRSSIVSSRSSRQRGRKAKYYCYLLKPTEDPASGIMPLGTERFGLEVRSDTKGGTGPRILSPLRIDECTHQCERHNHREEKNKTTTRNIYYEVNAYVNTLKTKSTRGQDIANQNLFVA